MSLEDDEGPEEAEQIIEFVYDIVKDYPTGITAAFLEEQYDKKFVQCGIARKLPKNWLRYVKMADEFEVRQVSTFTMLYIVSKDTIPKLPILSDLTDLAIDHVKEDANNEVVQISKAPATETIPKQELPKNVPSVLPPKVELQPWSPSSMPTSTTHVHILSATDPDNISFRLCSWDPMPDYLYTALQRDLNESQSPYLSPSDIAEGLVLAAKISDASWERVKIVRRSTNSAYWVVYAVDVGFFHLVHESDFRPLTEAVHAFNKVFLAKCKLDGIAPNDEHARQKDLWPKSAQQALYDLSVAAQGKKIDLIPTGEWKLGEEPATVPFVTCRLVVDGVDFAEKLVSMGLAKAA